MAMEKNSVSLFLPGAFLVFAPGPGSDRADALDLTAVADGRVGRTWPMTVPRHDAEAWQELPRDFLPVTVTPDGAAWWLETFGEAAADLAVLTGVAFPLVPWRPEALARALDLPRPWSGSRFYASVLAACGTKLADLPTGVLHQLAGLFQRCGSPWAPAVAALAERSARVFREAPLLARPAGSWRGRSRRDGQVAEVDPEAALAFLNGPVAGRLPGFQRRPQQEKMVRAVTKALTNGECLLMEGATGTGKSLSYLLPSLLWAAGGRRVLVATHTINLQEQLMNKDLPLLRAAGLEFAAALVKGRGNYLCLLRWSAVLKEEVTPAEAALFARVLVWSLETASGDRAELGLEGEGSEAWTRIQADSDGCPGAACPHWNADCFVTQARQAAEEADLLVANHSLLFSDLLAEGRVLPEYQAVVIDEAHHLEDGAGQFLGRRLALRGMALVATGTERLLGRLAALPALASSLWRPGMQRCQNSLAESRRLTVAFFEHLEKLVWSRADEERRPWRLRPGALAALDDEARALIRAWQDTAGTLEALTEGLAEGGEAWAALAADLGRLVAQWRQAGIDLAAIWGATDENQVYWIEPQRWSCALCSSPVEVAAVIRERILDQNRPVVLASATLTVGGVFEHFAERTGVSLLEPDRVSYCRAESPFDYRQQALFAVTAGFPAPEEEGYHEALGDALLSLVRAAGGRTMVLFTSHQTLRALYRALKEPLARQGVRLLGHGIDNSRSRLVEEFRATEKAVLFGAASFWEGVDIPGEALSLLVVVKLPFVPPGDPVQEARLEALARRRLDGFARLSVPQAVIRFKQGFGRLIRSNADRGAVVVLDSRLVTRRYGARFMASLPAPAAPFVAGIGPVTARVADWLAGP